MNSPNPPGPCEGNHPNVTGRRRNSTSHPAAVGAGGAARAVGDASQVALHPARPGTPAVRPLRFLRWERSLRGRRCGWRSAEAARTCRRTTGSTAASSCRPPSTATCTWWCPRTSSTATASSTSSGRRPSARPRCATRYCARCSTHHWEGPPVELASVADAPPGTGLGSSGAYTVCAIKALRAAAGMDTGARELAEAACEIEIGVLERRVGKQDQYAAAFGGVRAYTFHPDDSVEVRALALPDRVKQALRDECLLFFTGRERSASDLLSGQVSGTESGDDVGAERARPAPRAGPADLRGARGRRPRPLRRADERAVGGQAQPRPGHGDRRDGRAARARARRRERSAPCRWARAGAGSCSCTRPIRSAPGAALGDVRELRFGTDPHGCVAQATPFPAAAGAG